MNLRIRPLASQLYSGKSDEHGNLTKIGFVFSSAPSAQLGFERAKFPHRTPDGTSATRPSACARLRKYFALSISVQIGFECAKRRDLPRHLIRAHP